MRKPLKINSKLYAPQFLLDDKGNKEFVVLSMENFENLIEDLNDLAIIAERKKDPVIDYSEFRKQLKKDGKL